MGVFHLVEHLAVRRLHPELVADADVFERAELLIAMGGDGAIAFFPRPRRVGQVPRRSIQRFAAVTFDNRGSQTKPRDLEQADQIRSHRGVRDRRVRRCQRRFDGGARFLLRIRRVGGGERVIPHACQADDEQRTFEHLQHHCKSFSA